MSDTPIDPQLVVVLEAIRLAPDDGARLQILRDFYWKVQLDTSDGIVRRMLEAAEETKAKAS